ncbi:MAG: carboxypeptidase regulatory-like domain-containing protein [Janthinobacterium lividum]
MKPAPRLILVAEAMPAHVLQASATPATSPTQNTSPAPQTVTPSPAPPQVTVAVQGGVIQGKVIAGTAGKPGGVPLPGVAVTATNTLNGRKYATATDVDGAYTMKIPRNGRYVLRAELAGFAPVTAEVLLNGVPDAAGTPVAQQTSDFGMQLASRVEAAEERAATTTTGAGAASPSLLRGLQNLNLNAGSGAEDASAGGGNTGAALPSLGGVGQAADAGNETVAVNGQAGQTNGLAGISEDQLRDRIQEGVAAARASGQLPPGVDPTNAIVGMLGNMMGGGGGGRGGGPGGGGGFGRGSGGFRGLDPTQLHGGFNYQGEYAPLDSAPWSPTLQPEVNPSYSRNTFGGTLAGSPYIPGLIKPSKKQFGFLNFNVSRNTAPEVLTGTVPTAAERAGDFSGLTQTINGQTAVTPVYDPVTNAQFAYNGQPNVIDPTRITPQALYVLNHYYPLPNVPGAGTQNYNYQTITTSGTNSANLSARFIRNLGANSNGPILGGFGGGGGRGNRNEPASLRQSLNTNFSYSHSASDIRNIILPLSGATQTDGYNLGVGYVIGYGRLNNNSSITWNRSNGLTRNYFTNTSNDPAAAAGIALPSTGAIGSQPNFYNGLPSLAIDNFLSVNNTDPQDNIGQTISFTEQLSYRHKKHNMRFGFDVRRVHQDFLGGGTPLGSFTFTGYNTENPCSRGIVTAACPQGSSSSTTTTSEQTSGSAFADFLLGLPQQTQIQAGLSKIYLRENVVDWYANDDFRVANGLTINGGLRFEYFGPFSEKNGHLVNLTGVTPGTTSVGCVTPDGVSVQTTAGLLNCAKGSTSSLLNADRAMYAPRFGLAYRPHFLKDTVLRGGYGINFNTGQFATFAKSLAYQAPFAAAQNNVLSTATNATGCEQAEGLQGSNLTLANGFSCSTKLFQNTYAVDPNYRLGLVQVYNADIQRTLPLGIVLNVGYNGSHGSDLNVVNAPNHTPTTVTTPNAVAFTYQQSDAESTFNALTVNVQKRLQKGIQLAAKYQYAHSIDDASSFGGANSASTVQNDEDLHAERSNSSFDVRHQLTGSWLYELPVGPNRTFLNKGGTASKLLDGFSVSGTYTLASGSYFTPSYQSTAGQIAAGGTYTLRPDRVLGQSIRGAGSLTSFFNKNAFAAPGEYGSASRYSIEGPGQVLVTASLSRTIALGETRSFEARMTAANVFNTVQYNGINTTLDSATFGQVTGAAAMRQITFVGRFRF